MLELLREGGWPNLVLAGAGFLAALLAVAALVSAMVGKRQARALGIASLVAATLLAGFGAAMASLGRDRIQEVLTAPSLDRSQRALILKIGHAETRSVALFGLASAALPLLAGTAALLAAAAARRGRVAPPAPQASRAQASALGPAGFGAMGAADLAMVAAAIVFVRQPSHPDLTLDEATWRLVRASEEVARVSGTDLRAACPELARVHAGKDAEGKPGPTPDASRVPEAEKAGDKCIEHFLESALADRPGFVRTRLEALAKGSLPRSEAMDRRLAVEIAKSPEPSGGDPVRQARKEATEFGMIGALGDDPRLGAPDPLGAPPVGFGSGQGRLGGPGGSTPKITPGKIAVEGRLSAEAVHRIVRQNHGRFRLCYENGLATKPDLSGEIAGTFVIGRDGSLLGPVRAGKSTLPDETVVSCVLRAFAGLSFPQPEGGTVAVTYPLVFAPPSPAPASP